MSRVYLIAQPSIPRGPNVDTPKLDALPKWGDVHVLLRAGEDPRQSPAQCRERVYARLRNFDPDTDYIVWVGGDILAALIVGAVLCDLAFDEEQPFSHVRYLSWSRGHRPEGGRSDVGGRFEVLTVPIADHVQA